jgi:hypothetical protein
MKEIEKHEIPPIIARHGGNFWYLFAGLIFTFLALPLSRSLGVGRYSMTLLFSFFMLVAVWSLSVSRRIFHLGTLLVLSISSISVFNYLFTEFHQILELLGLLLMLIFCSLSCWIAARNVFIWHKVDLNSLVGAFCVYLLLGLIWALLYRLLHLYGWATFSGNIHENGQEVFPDLLYFSFVTLASLGYGDIAPIGGLVRTFAYLEAVIGQFYLAVMVASLVGVYSNRRGNKVGDEAQTQQRRQYQQ